VRRILHFLFAGRLRFDCCDDAVVWIVYYLVLHFYNSELSVERRSRSEHAARSPDLPSKLTRPDLEGTLFRGGLRRGTSRFDETKTFWACYLDATNGIDRVEIIEAESDRGDTEAARRLASAYGIKVWGQARKPGSVEASVEGR
jgi:hypothetical protein